MFAVISLWVAFQGISLCWKPPCRAILILTKFSDSGHLEKRAEDDHGHEEDGHGHGAEVASTSAVS